MAKSKAATARRRAAAAASGRPNPDAARQLDDTILALASRSDWRERERCRLKLDRCRGGQACDHRDLPDVAGKPHLPPRETLALLDAVEASSALSDDICCVLARLAARDDLGRHGLGPLCRLLGRISERAWLLPGGRRPTAGMADGARPEGPLLTWLLPGPQVRPPGAQAEDALRRVVSGGRP